MTDQQQRIAEASINALMMEDVIGDVEQGFVTVSSDEQA